MRIQDLNIERYIKSYKEMSAHLRLHDEYKELYGEILALYSKYQLHEFKTERRLKVIEERLRKYQLIIRRNEEVLLIPFFYYPTIREWREYDIILESFFNLMVEEFNDLRKNSALDVKELINKKLSELNGKEYEFIPFLIDGLHIPIKNEFLKFIDELAHIKFAKYLESELAESDMSITRATENRFVWKAGAMELSQIVKALSLTSLKGFAAKKLMDILCEALEPHFVDDQGSSIKSHRLDGNMSDLKGKGQNYVYITDVMSEALKDYVKGKLSK